ncbi:SDR family oxidoreductase [Neorhizobium alkalisoli]|uniref:Putative oxidoreductase n=1 Tax=Neorhizobium alkalisoli TaxID=528178 RepID=A0A561R354_9HYPH|nr:SDR family oxidoreductase [Neorhizobium alkalisoli]TWF57056.1 putative oxidoreductase [Neorhizobium alkalisoli]
MKMNGNTILITGGGSGIGRALAEAFHALGNSVIITGRRKSALDTVTAANPGMQAMVLDINDAEAIKGFAAEITKTHPALNIVIHNAGIMVAETIGDAPDYLETAEATIATNLLGPIRLTAALLPHLKTQGDASVVNVSSGLAFIPFVLTPTYSATKAGIHSYSMAIREQLKGTSVKVVEIAPPYVQTELMGEHQASDPNAMPLTDFISEVMQILTDNPDAKEVIVERCKPLRFAAESGNFDAMFAGVNSRH